MAHSNDPEKAHLEETRPVEVAVPDDEEDSAEKRPECFSNTAKEIMFTAVATMSVGTASFLVGAVTVMSTFVQRDLNMTIPEVTWLASSSSLTSGAFLLGFGRLCDLFGRKTILLGSLTSFTILCIGAGFVHDGIALDTVNGLMGLTSASSVPAALGILGAAYGKPSKRKNYAFASFAAGNPLGFVVGMIIAGVATQLSSWRATYWALAVIFAIITVISAYSTPKDTTVKRSLSRETLKRFDLQGIVLCIVGIASLSAALTEGGDAVHGWRTNYVIALLVIGAVFVCAFTWWETRTAYALVPMKVWRDRNFSLLTAILGLGFLGFPVSIFWTALYFQRVLHFNPIMVAVHMLPAAVSGTIINIIAGGTLHKISNKLLMGLGSCAYATAFLLLSFNKSTSSYWAFAFPALTIMVIGADFQFNVVNMYIMTSRPREEQSVSGGLLQTVTRLASTISFGIATAIYNAELKHPSLASYWSGDPVEPYTAVYWYCFATATLSIFLVPFLTIKTQGHKVVGSPKRQETSPEPSEKQVIHEQPNKDVDST